MIQIRRRTISNLARDTKVTRRTIYKWMLNLNIKTDENREFTTTDYELLKDRLSGLTKINKTKKSLPKVKESVEPLRIEIKPTENLFNLAQSTLLQRLKKAKTQYDYNDSLICKFQAEADEYFRLNSKTTIPTHNGTETAIPAITSLEKYVKLNIALSKLISDIEADLDLTADDNGDDPFA